MQHLGTTRDDAAGEAFDKIGKILGLSYPAGPQMDKLARGGNPNRFVFPVADIPDFDFSFSGLKTAVLYFVRDNKAKDADFIKNNLEDICASVQANIVKTLLRKFDKAAQLHGITRLAIGGGVSANSGLREGLADLCQKTGRTAFIPKFEFCTDNAAMIAMAGTLKLQRGKIGALHTVPMARIPL
jgi:N6-L-threonylcarbamoyladenine synthase